MENNQNRQRYQQEKADQLCNISYGKRTSSSSASTTFEDVTHNLYYSSASSNPPRPGIQRHSDYNDHTKGHHHNSTIVLLDGPVGFTNTTSTYEATSAPGMKKRKKHSSGEQEREAEEGMGDNKRHKGNMMNGGRSSIKKITGVDSNKSSQLHHSNTNANSDPPQSSLHQTDINDSNVKNVSSILAIDGTKKIVHNVGEHHIGTMRKDNDTKAVLENKARTKGNKKRHAGNAAFLSKLNTVADYNEHILRQDILEAQKRQEERRQKERKQKQSKREKEKRLFDAFAYNRLAEILSISNSKTFVRRKNQVYFRVLDHSSAAYIDDDLSIGASLLPYPYSSGVNQPGSQHDYSSIPRRLGGYLPTKSGSSDMIYHHENRPLNRTEIIAYASEMIKKLAKENEELQLIEESYLYNTGRRNVDESKMSSSYQLQTSPFSNRLDAAASLTAKDFKRKSLETPVSPVSIHNHRMMICHEEETRFSIRSDDHQTRSAPSSISTLNNKNNNGWCAATQGDVASIILAARHLYASPSMSSSYLHQSRIWSASNTPHTGGRVDNNESIINHVNISSAGNRQMQEMNTRFYHPPASLCGRSTNNNIMNSQHQALLLELNNDNTNNALLLQAMMHRRYYGRRILSQDSTIKET